MQNARLVSAVVGAVLLFTACGGDDGGEPTVETTPTGATTEARGDDSECVEGETRTTESGLQIEDVECGDGDVVEGPASVVTVHYVGRLQGGKKFDSSRDRGEPITFALGDLIPGWVEGIPGMQVGGRRRLTIPPELGYGESGQPPAIPPNSTLVFDIELIEVENP